MEKRSERKNFRPDDEGAEIIYRNNLKKILPVLVFIKAFHTRLGSSFRQMVVTERKKEEMRETNERLYQI